MRMSRFKTAFTASLATSLTLGLLSPAAAACLNPAAKPNAAQSPANRAALIELYTSEGCDSCPPADRWLESVLKKYSPEQVIPLSLHVNYWDYIGWKDRFATPQFGARHSALVQSNGKKTAYTPHVFNSGKDFTSWRSEAQLEASLAQLNRQPASVKLRLEQVGFIKDAAANGRSLKVQLDSQFASNPMAGTQAYLAVVEDGLVSMVTRGENAGATLNHASVVRAWQGPFALDAAAKRYSVQFDLPNDVNVGKLRVIAFAQAPQHGEGLQAVALGVCA